MSKRKYYSDELAEAVKARYDGTTDVINALMAEFHVPRHTIAATAQRFGLSKKKPKDWTTEEEAQLKELWGYKPLPQIMEILGRSRTSILNKYKRLGLEGATRAGDYLTARAVSEILQVDIHVVTDRMIAKQGLKAQKKAMRGVRKMTMIKHSDLLKWLKNNPDKWDSRRVEFYALGEEPKWLQEKRDRDKKENKKLPTKWTPAEDAKAILLFKEGLTYDQIAEQMPGRTGCGVEHRLNRLDVWGTGKFVGDRKYKTSGKFAEMKELADRKKLITKLAELLLMKRNQMAYDGYWQKSMCMNWHDVKGCKAGQENCDECTEFIRIREQYCVRCGVTFFKREISKTCDPCAAARKKQYQRKWARQHKKGA